MTTFILIINMLVAAAYSAWHYVDNSIGQLAVAFREDIRHAIAYYPPQAKYVPMTYNEMFFKSIRVAILFCAMFLSVLFGAIILGNIDVILQQFILWRI